MKKMNDKGLWRGVGVSVVCALALLLAACGDSDFTYSSYHCNLTLDNSLHMDATLNSAMNENAKGIFCLIYFKQSGSNIYYTFTNNQGNSTTSPFNAIDQRLNNQQRLGMNSGIIVGFGNLSDPATFYAYDHECPNCYDPDAIPVKSYPLSMSSAGIATCSSCKRQYNMNTGGNLISGTGKGLTNYRASTTGQNGVLHVY